MAKRRLIGKPGSKYHVISRFVDRKFATGTDEEKGIMLQFVMRQAAFSGVEVLTYCIMGNHFHLLLHVPERPSEISEKEILRRLGNIWKSERVKELRETFKAWRKMSAVGDELVEEKLERFRNRMYSLPEFMKDLKQRYSKWYNHKEQRKGTLFEERYKSVLVEDGATLRLMAAYIELNSVRAGLVDDPADFPFCGYAQACADNIDRQRGLRAIMSKPHDKRLPSWKSIEPRYRLLMVEHGREIHHGDGTKKKRGFTTAQIDAARRAADQENADEKPADAERLSSPFSLLKKSRTMTDSLILGGKDFVESTIDDLTTEIGVKNPKAREVPDSELCQLANIRRDGTKKKGEPPTSEATD